MNPYLLGLILVALVVAVAAIGQKAHRQSRRLDELEANLADPAGPLAYAEMRTDETRQKVDIAHKLALESWNGVVDNAKVIPAMGRRITRLETRTGPELESIRQQLDAIAARPAFPDLGSLADSARQVYDNALFNLRSVEALVEASGRPDDAPTAARAHRDAALARLETGQAGVVEAFLSAPSPMAEPGPAH